MQQQPVRLSTMQQHIEESQLQNHRQHEDIPQPKPNEDDEESWKIDALLCQQRDMALAIEQSLQESNQTSIHPTTHHNQSQSPADRSHTTRRRTQTPPSERYNNTLNERSSLIDDIINNTQEGQYDLNVLKEMGLIRSSSDSNNDKEEVLMDNDDRQSSTHSWLKEAALDAEDINPDVLKELGVEDVNVDREEPLKFDSIAQLKATFLSGHNVLAADTSDDMVRGWKKIDDANQQQQQPNIPIDDHGPLPPTNGILDIIPGKSNNSLASAELHQKVEYVYSKLGSFPINLVVYR